jgi:hypothetical protein
MGDGLDRGRLGRRVALEFLVVDGEGRIRSDFQFIEGSCGVVATVAASSIA